MQKAVATIAAGLALLLFVTLPAQASDHETFTDVPGLFGTFEPIKGAWSEYEVLNKASGKKVHMKMAIVDIEGDNYWYEVTNREEGSINVIKMLIAGDPNNSENIKRLMIKSGDEPAREMPLDFVKMGRKMAVSMFSSRSGVPADDAGLTIKDNGEKTITVPAGRLTGIEKQIISKEGEVLATYLFNADILPFGIIISDSKDSVMKLTGNGSDAKSAITGHVEKMITPPGMPEMPRGMPMGMGGKQQ